MENEKDIFDLLREESENLSETPSQEAWKKLEKRLFKTRKSKRPRRPMLLHLGIISLAVILILLLSIVGWFVTKQHQDIVKSRKEFAQLQFLDGRWVCIDLKTLDIMDWHMKDSLWMVADKSIYFQNDLLSKTSIAIKNSGKENIFVYNNQNYFLKYTENNIFVFESKKGEEIRLRKAGDDRYTLSFGEGMIFLFKKEP